MYRSKSRYCYLLLLYHLIGEIKRYNITTGLIYLSMYDFVFVYKQIIAKMCYISNILV